MQNKIKLVTVGYIALISRKSGAVSTKYYKTAKNAQKALQLHLSKAKQCRKEQIINAILKGASLLHTIAEKLENAKNNLRRWGYSFARWVLVFKLRKAYNSALYSA